LFLLLDLDDTVKDKEAKALEKAKKRALSSSILKELRHEYYEEPEEIKVCKYKHCQGSRCRSRFSFLTGD
jgi:ribosomal protein S21